MTCYLHVCPKNWFNWLGEGSTIFNHFMEYPKAGDFVFYELMILNSLSQNSKVQGHHKVMQGVFLKSLSISSSRLSDLYAQSHRLFFSVFNNERAPPSQSIGHDNHLTRIPLQTDSTLTFQNTHCRGRKSPDFSPATVWAALSSRFWEQPMPYCKTLNDLFL